VVEKVAPAQYELRWLPRTWSVGLMALLAATWPLWTPVSDLPRVPAFGWLLGLPPAVDYLLLVLLGFSLSSAVSQPDRRRWLASSALGLAALMALDQNRWQPWAYQWLLLAIAWSALPEAKARVWLRALLISIYLYAAAAKLDVVFVHSTGQQFVDALLKLAVSGELLLPRWLRSALACAMPIAEGGIGLLLVFPSTRRAGVALGVYFHAIVAVALSPLGLGHSLGVLLWNLLSALWLWLLFWPRQTDESPATESSSPAASSQPSPGQAPPNRLERSGTQQLAARALLTIVIVAPLTHPLGWWDRWPSWGLYAPRCERLEMFVHQRAIARLPAELQVEEKSGSGEWRRVKLQPWVLQQNGAPRYPQNRVGLAMAVAVANQARLGSYVRVEVQSAAGRMDASRQATLLEGADAVGEYLKSRYWLNTQCRW